MPNMLPLRPEEYKVIVVSDYSGKSLKMLTKEEQTVTISINIVLCAH